MSLSAEHKPRFEYSEVHLHRDWCGWRWRQPRITTSELQIAEITVLSVNPLRKEVGAAIELVTAPIQIEQFLVMSARD